MHMDKYGILSESTASELGIRSGDEFELIISADVDVSATARAFADSEDARGAWRHALHRTSRESRHRLRP